ncbi:MAG: hypothetical protein H7Y42_01530 [Chitinophagaceae bacterium]|nr:hypothetical protein [Chitinophagaceae bacterium]
MKFLNSTRESITLYFSLRSRGVPAELEKFDGYKTINIAVVPALLNIEVDDRYHVLKSNQEIVDVLQAFSTIRKGYLNLKIPKNLIRTHLEDTMDYVSQFVHISFKGN